MSYLAQMQMTQDHHLIARSTACAASIGIPDPRGWVMANLWQLSASDGWADAYAAVEPFDPDADPAAWVPSVGRNPDVITDGMILAGVRAVWEAETPGTAGQEGVGRGDYL